MGGAGAPFQAAASGRSWWAIPLKTCHLVQAVREPNGLREPPSAATSVKSVSVPKHRTKTIPLRPPGPRHTTYFTYTTTQYTFLPGHNFSNRYTYDAGSHVNRSDTGEPATIWWQTILLATIRFTTISFTTIHDDRLYDDAREPPNSQFLASPHRGRRGRSSRIRECSAFLAHGCAPPCRRRQ